MFQHDSIMYQEAYHTLMLKTQGEVIGCLSKDVTELTLAEKTKDVAMVKCFDTKKACIVQSFAKVSARLLFMLLSPDCMQAATVSPWHVSDVVIHACQPIWHVVMVCRPPLSRQLCRPGEASPPSAMLPCSEKDAPLLGSLLMPCHVGHRAACSWALSCARSFAWPRLSRAVAAGRSTQR